MTSAPSLPIRCQMTCWPAWDLCKEEFAGRTVREYDFRMHKARVTVTVRREVLAKAERQVRRGRAKSVSAWVDAAMEEKARREDLAALLAEMKAENGPATAEEQAWALGVLGL